MSTDSRSDGFMRLRPTIEQLCRGMNSWKRGLRRKLQRVYDRNSTKQRVVRDREFRLQLIVSGRHWLWRWISYCLIQGLFLTPLQSVALAAPHSVEPTAPVKLGRSVTSIVNPLKSGRATRLKRVFSTKRAWTEDSSSTPPTPIKRTARSTHTEAPARTRRQRSRSISSTRRSIRASSITTRAEIRLGGFITKTTSAPSSGTRKTESVR